MSRPPQPWSCNGRQRSQKPLLRAASSALSEDSHTTTASAEAGPSWIRRWFYHHTVPGQPLVAQRPAERLHRRVNALGYALGETACRVARRALAATVVPSRRRLRWRSHGSDGSSIIVHYRDSIWMLKHRHTARQDACRAPGTPSRGCSIRATNPNGRGLGSQIDDVRRDLATKSSTPCNILVYLVVYPSLIHIITLKYARTLHKRRPRDARTNAHRGC